VNKTKTVGKTYARNNFSNIVKSVSQGDTYWISNRGDIVVAIVPAEEVDKSKSRKKTPKEVAYSNAFGIWKDRTDIKDSVDWVRKHRSSRLKRIYGKSLPDRYKHNS